MIFWRAPESGEINEIRNILFSTSVISNHLTVWILRKVRTFKYLPRAAVFLLVINLSNQAFHVKKNQQTSNRDCPQYFHRDKGKNGGEPVHCCLLAETKKPIPRVSFFTGGRVNMVYPSSSTVTRSSSLRFLPLSSQFYSAWWNFPFPSFHPHSSSTLEWYFGSFQRISFLNHWTPSVLAFGKDNWENNVGARLLWGIIAKLKLLTVLEG